MLLSICYFLLVSLYLYYPLVCLMYFIVFVTSLYDKICYKCFFYLFIAINVQVIRKIEICPDASLPPTHTKNSIFLHSEASPKFVFSPFHVYFPDWLKGCYQMIKMVQKCWRILLNAGYMGITKWLHKYKIKAQNICSSY